MRFKNPYFVLGLALVLMGAWMAPAIFILAESVPLTALALSMIILGMVSLTIARVRPEVPPEASGLLLESSLHLLGSVVEELGLQAKAIYLPSTFTGGVAQALVPLHTNSSHPTILNALPRRFIVRYGPGQEDLGLLFNTPGTVAIKLLKEPVAPQAQALESALSHLLVGTFALADQVRVHLDDQRVTAEIRNPTLTSNGLRTTEVMGSPVASIVAAVAAEALQKPVMLEQESQDERGLTMRLQVLP